jgi:hypothetical protein
MNTIFLNTRNGPAQLIEIIRRVDPPGTFVRYNSDGTTTIIQDEKVAPYWFCKVQSLKSEYFESPAIFFIKVPV